MQTDIAVIEQRVDDRWEIVAYIGPDRHAGPIEVAPGTDLRIRYLESDV